MTLMFNARSHHPIQDRRRARRRRATSTPHRSRSPPRTPTAGPRSASCSCAAWTSAGSCSTPTTGAGRGSDLDANPYAALCFHWPTLEEQIRIEGAITRAAARRVRRLLRRPTARKPARRLDLGAERDPRVARKVRRTVRRDRSPLRRPASPPPAALGRLPHRPVAHRILVRPNRQVARSDSVCAGGCELEGSEAVSVTSAAQRSR